MEKALARLWDRFLISPFSQPSELAKVGLESYTGRSGCHDWDGTGDFYGTSEVWLKRPDGIQFFWTVGVLFEQGEHEGQHWEQGGAYSYVSIATDPDGVEQVYYRVGSVQLPSERMTIDELIPFSEQIATLADKCFNDLSFVYGAQGFEKLLALAQEKAEVTRQREKECEEKGLIVTTVYDQYDLNNWASNPIRSNYHA